MKFAAAILRYLMTVLTLALLDGARAQGQVDMEYAEFGETTVQSAAPAQKADAPSPKDDASTKVTLAPEVEKRVEEIVAKARQRLGDVWTLRMKKEIEGITNVAGLKSDAVQALNTASEKAIEASLRATDPEIETFRKQLAGMPTDQVKAMLDQAVTQLNKVNDGSQTDPNAPQPDAQDVWTKAVHQTLTPAQYDTWSTARGKKDAPAEKEIADMLKSGADRTRDQETTEIMVECKSMEAALKLPADRATQLETLGKSAVEQSVELWRKREEQVLLSMQAIQRRQMVSRGFYIGVAPNESPTAVSSWTNGLAQLLTGAEMAQLQAAKDARKEKRKHVMALVLTMLLDEKIAFTGAQRQMLQPIAERLVLDVPQAFPPENPNAIYYSIPPAAFYSVTTKVGEAELKPILDAAQIKRWQSLPAINAQSYGGDNISNQGDDTEPEDVERAISSFFYEKTAAERKHSLDANTLRAEDVARVAALNGQATERLQAAARGATEQYLTTWKWFTEQQIRAQLQDVTPQNVRQRLEGMQEFFFQRNFGISDQMDIWDQTLHSELTPQQQDAWKKETAAREAYRANAISALALSEFDRRAHLTDEQWNKLQPLVASVTTDYNPGMAQVLSGMNGMPWYLTGPYMLLPFAGLDEKDLKTILTKDQMDIWTGSQDYANANNVWQMIKQVHAQRAQRAHAVIED